MIEKTSNHVFFSEYSVKMNLFLDMDETLIGSPKYIDWSGKERIWNPYKRPHLDEFFEFVFGNFETVNIFTAASEEWFDEINTYIFKPILSDNYEFTVIKTRKSCTYKVDLNEVMNSGKYVIIKRLAHIFKTKQKYKNINKYNNLIIDNDYMTFSNYNSN